MSEPAVVAPERRGWLALLALFTTAGLLESVFWGQINAFIPLHLPALGVSAEDLPRITGIVVAVGSGIGIPTLPLWGALAERYGRKPLIVRSFVVYVLGCLIAASATGVPALIVGRTIMGLSLGNSGLMMATLGDRVPVKHQALAFGVFNSTPPLGVFLGPLIGGPLVDARGVGALLLVDGLIMLALVLALALGYRDDAAPRVHRPVRALARESLVILWASPRLRALFPALFFLFGGWMIANLFLPLQIADRFPTDEVATRVGWVLAGGGLGTVLLAPALGALADRRGVWQVLLACSFIEAALWLLPTLAPTLGLFALAWALANGLAAATMALAFTALSTSAPAHARARVMAFAYLPSTAGYAIAAGVGSLVGAGLQQALFPVAGLLTLIGALGLVYSRRRAVEPASEHSNVSTTAR